MRRVGITGFGIVAPAGVGKKPFEDSLRSARSGVVTVPEAAELGYHCQVAARVPVDALPSADPDCPAEIHFAKVAANEAIESAALSADLLHSDRTGICVASCAGATTNGYHLGRAFGDPLQLRRLAKRLPTTSVPLMPAAHIAIEHGVRGRVAGVNAACAGGLVAIGQACEWVAAGVVDVCLAGGTDPMDPGVSHRCFDSWRILASNSNDDPPAACRPYDRARCGFVPGEGAGIVVVESMEHAEARKARILVEPIGFAATNDGLDIKQPSGEGLERAIRIAWDAAVRAGAERLEYANPHGAGTLLGDACEIAALRACFGDSPPMVSSIKPLCGHGLAACGAIELIATIAMMEGGFVTPTRNLENVADDCQGVDHVKRVAREAKISVALATNMGLGGTNAALALRRVGS